MSAEPKPQSLALPSGYAVDVRTAPEELVVRAPGGGICLRVLLTPEGPRVEIDAGSIALRSQGEISLAGSRIVLDGREGIALRSGADLAIEAEGSLRTTATEQLIEATKGDIHVEANDDVRVDGERIRLNSPDAAPIRRLDREALERGEGVLVPPRDGEGA